MILQMEAFVLNLKNNSINKSSAERGNIRPLGFLVWKKFLHYLNLETKISIKYFDR